MTITENKAMEVHSYILWADYVHREDGSERQDRYLVESRCDDDLIRHWRIYDITESPFNAPCIRDMEALGTIDILEWAKEEIKAFMKGYAR